MKAQVRLGAVALTFALSGAASSCGGAPEQPPRPAASATELDRTVLPIAEPKRPTYSELDARKAKPPARFEVKAPQGRPMSSSC